MATTTTDPQQIEEFAARMVGIINDAMLALMVSIGHRTGLFDHMAELRPATSDEIATKAELNERYVREWLGAMVTGGVVDYDEAADTYSLPSYAAPCLTRSAGPDNLATLAQFVSLLGEVEGGIVDAFTHGGGVPYSAYPRFHALMAEDSAQVHDAALVDVIIPLVPGLPAALEKGIDVLDVGCGSGHAMNLLAQAFPNSHCAGIDISDEAISTARKEAADLGLGNATFEVDDVARLDGPARFDLITAFDAIHDQVNPTRVLSGIYEALRPGGTFLCVDIAASSNLADNRDHPLGPLLYTVSTMHCMTVSLAEGGAGLGTAWGEQKALEMLTEAGFGDIEIKRVEGDIANNYYIAHKP